MNKSTAQANATTNATSARMKVKAMLLAMSITTTVSGWAIISVVHPPAALANTQRLSFQVATQLDRLELARVQRPVAVAITRSSR